MTAQSTSTALLTPGVQLLVNVLRRSKQKIFVASSNVTALFIPDETADALPS